MCLVIGDLHAAPRPGDKQPMAAYLVPGLGLIAECLIFVIGLDAALTVGNAVLALVAAWAVILSGDD
jgi:hypothetical protein